KINVLFMGTSRILAGIAPTFFDELSGGRTLSYNLALPALPISSAYFVLKDYLEKNPSPEWIIMQLHINRCRKCTLFNYYSSQGLIRLGEIFSLFMNTQSKNIAVNYIFPFKMYKFFTVQYLYNGIFHPSRLRRLQEDNRIILDRMIGERGYYFIEEQAVSPDNRLPDDFGEMEKINAAAQQGPEYDPFDDPFVEKFFDLTRENGVKVLLIQPVYWENQLLQYEKIPLQFEMILKEYDHVFLAKQGWKLRRYENRLFSDRTHLNKDGAKRFTREIYQEFHEVFPGVRCGNGKKNEG
ncbi:MAG: hypothetical protein JSV88_15405, partial [Candidatus Aminicenantes bacterium]